MTKSQILACARETFGSKGYAETSLRQIAEKVGIRTPSLYAHFPSKEALYEAVYSEVSEEHSIYFAELAAKTSGLDPLDRLHALLTGIEAYYRDRPDLADFSLRAAIAGTHPSGTGLRKIFLASETNLVLAVRQSFQEGVDVHQFAPGDPEEFCAFFLVVMDGIFLQLAHYEPTIYQRRFDLAWQQISRMLTSNLNGDGDGNG